MYLSLLIVFLFISFILIALGLIFNNHTELSIVGFLFLFLLSLTIIGNDIEYKTGENLSYYCVYDNGTVQPDPSCGINSTLYPVEKSNVYTSWDGSGTFSHLVGYYMAIAAGVGMIGVFLSIRRQKKID